MDPLFRLEHMLSDFSYLFKHNNFNHFRTFVKMMDFTNMGRISLETPGIRRVTRTNPSFITDISSVLSDGSVKRHKGHGFFR